MLFCGLRDNKKKLFCGLQDNNEECFGQNKRMGTEMSHTVCDLIVYYYI